MFKILAKSYFEVLGKMLSLQKNSFINTAAIKRQFCFLQFVVYVCIVKYFRTVLIPPG